MTTRPAVSEGQLYRDLAPDMKDRHRYLRVTAVTNAQASLLVENDLGGQVGRVTRASLTRLSSSAFELLERPRRHRPAVPETAQRHEPGPRRQGDARRLRQGSAACRPHHRAAGSLTMQTFHSSIGEAMGAANKANADMAARIVVARAVEDDRRVVEAIVHRYRTGIPSRDLPSRFGSWKTVWARHSR